ncbi:very short patch repair endonuclease [Cryptosporangium minutisporangium]|uniref:Very short patch repair endonuclease n=1 Tax=Cryptosporangium minutisporangium TaxID=113569 RepID=A0ABP6SW53_9ACTN
MQANKSRDTNPELALRRAVHARGMRYRVNTRPVAGLRRTADLVFTKARVAIFLDGCFWHGCPQHHTVAKTNATFWAEKVRRNRERDAETDRLIAEHGWTVVRIWEHEDPTEAAERIQAVIEQARRRAGQSHTAVRAGITRNAESSRSED